MAGAHIWLQTAGLFKIKLNFNYTNLITSYDDSVIHATAIILDLVSLKTQSDDASYDWHYNSWLYPAT